jgi:hypothetical protein
MSLFYIYTYNRAIVYFIRLDEVKRYRLVERMAQQRLILFNYSRSTSAVRFCQCFITLFGPLGTNSHSLFSGCTSSLYEGRSSRLAAFGIRREDVRNGAESCNISFEIFPGIEIWERRTQVVAILPDLNESAKLLGFNQVWHSFHSHGLVASLSEMRAGRMGGVPNEHASLGIPLFGLQLVSIKDAVFDEAFCRSEPL